MSTALEPPAGGGRRSQEHEVLLPANPEEVFALLHTPSAIRAWWSAARAVVVPREGGLWVVAWGDDEDRPEVVARATLLVFDPPRRMLLGDFDYAAGDPLPFAADLSVEFEVEPTAGGTRLRVLHEGFPEAPSADAFFAACEAGWRDTLRGIDAFLRR